MTPGEIIAAIALGITVMGFYIKLKIDIAKVQKDYVSIRKDFDEHKIINKEDRAAFIEQLDHYRKENREDHGKLFDAVTEMNKVFTELKVEIVKNSKK